MNFLKCWDILVGNYVICGISGGEFKRLVVAFALCTLNFRVMFLDEFILGLDFLMVVDVINCLFRF